jgi:fructokinase
MGCIGTWVSGPGLEADHAGVAGNRLSTEEIAAHAAAGDAAAQATLDRHAGRLARGIAHVVNIFDQM